MLSRRGDSSTNIIIFLTLLIAALLLVTWYIQSLRPTRHIIGTVTEDSQELSQHLANACGATRYNATYHVSTTVGFYTSNTTHLCIYTDTFGTCRSLPCAAISPVRIPLSENLLVRIERSDGDGVLIAPILRT